MDIYFFSTLCNKMSDIVEEFHCQFAFISVRLGLPHPDPIVESRLVESSDQTMLNKLFVMQFSSKCGATASLV